MVALAPAIPDMRPGFDHQRIDAELVEPSGDGQTGLGAAYDEDGRLAILVCRCLATHIDPIVATEISRIRSTRRAIGADFFLVPRQGFKRRRKQPRFRIAVGVVRRRQAHDARALPVHCREFENSLDTIDAETTNLTRRPATGRQMEAMGTGARLLRREACTNSVRALRGREVPSESQDVAPVAVLVKQRADPIGVP